MEHTLKVLIVDDDPEFVKTLTSALENESYAVVSVSERRQAEQTIRSEEPDMVILGAILPRGDAFNFHKWLKQSPSFGSLPMMVINVPPDKQLTKGWRMTEGMQCEAEDYLARPVSMDALIPRIKTLMDRTVKKIRVLIVDDHAVVRDGIRSVLALERDIQVVGEAVNGREGLEKSIELVPDVVVMDIVMPEMNGLEAAEEICHTCKSTRVLMLTQFDDDENVIASRKAGAMGFIPKATASSSLLTGIRSVARGDESWIPSLS